MRKPVLWTGVISGAFVGACSRVMGFAFGKAIAFTYAVIVSVIANLVFDFVREPPRSLAPHPITAAAVAITDGADAARASLPASAAAATAPVAPPQSSALPAAPPPAGNLRPGPGSGGLY